MRRIERDDKYYDDVMRALTPDDIGRAEIALQKRHRRRIALKVLVVVCQIVVLYWAVYTWLHG